MAYEKRPTYVEMLRDPRWQRKRLEILERDGFACAECGACDRELHVHHGYYARGKAPWEYEAGSLRTLCATCHEDAGELAERLNRLAGSFDFGQARFLIGVTWALSWLIFKRQDEEWQIYEDEWRVELETSGLFEEFVFGAELVLQDAQRTHDEHLREIAVAIRKRELIASHAEQPRDCRA